jgi:crotonobetainyl-CoA:carnitine CoA-transferase CaiB-like acyl-CoA transferase
VAADSRPPLRGLRALDLTRVMAGPMAAQILGDLGVDVIKVEARGEGDLARASASAFLKDREGKPTGESSFYIASNRNKRSITVDFAKPQGQQIVRALAAKADIALENYKPGTLAKYGLDYESLRALNPRLVYCSITGYGQDGPKADQPGFDPVFQAQCGLMSVTGFPDSAPGGGPVKAGAHVVDLTAGYYAVIGILAALHERDNGSRQGQHLDIGLFDAGMAMMSNNAQQYLLSDVAPTRQGNGNQSGGPSAVFDCADRPIYLLAGPGSWSALCELLGVPEIATDARFNTSPLRHNNHELVALLNERTRLWKSAELLDALARINVPAGPVNDVAEAFADAQAQHRGIAIGMPHPLSDKLRVVASPLRLSRTPVAYDRPPPLAGEHTAEILKDLLGYDDATIAALKAAEVT